jgi:hypothetical protein
MKIRYKTLKDAKLARASRAQGGEVFLRVYKCAECGGYHLTSQEQRTVGSTLWRPAVRVPAAAA